MMDIIDNYKDWKIKKNDSGDNMVILCSRWSSDFFNLKKVNKYFKRYVKTVEPVILSKNDGYSKNILQVFMAYKDEENDNIDNMVQRFKNMIDKSDLIQSIGGDYDDE